MSPRALQVAVLADTHLHSGSRPLPPIVTDHLEHVDVILHAGDLVSPSVLETLGRFAPVHAVLGNNDHELVGRLPERLELDLGGVAVAMVHDSGTRAGRESRLARWFPTAQIVVFGHSHEPLDVDTGRGPRIFNPGSPTQRRRQPHPTMGLLTLGDGRVHAHRIVRTDA